MTTLTVWLKKKWLPLVFLSLLILITYANSLRNDFISDDLSAIRDNPEIGQVSYFLNTPYLNTAPRLFILFLIHKFFGLYPIFYRLPNILFHLGSSWVIYYLGGLLAASLFAVHPLATEAVSWISGGPYVFATFFLLLSLAAYIKESYRASLILFLLTLLNCEKMLFFPFVLVAYEICLGKKVNGRRLFPFFLLSFIWIAYLLSQLGNRFADLNESGLVGSIFYNPLIQIPVVISAYLALIFWPQNLSFHHLEISSLVNNLTNEFPRLPLEYFLRLGAFLLFLSLIVYFFQKDKKISFWLVFFLVSLLPTLTPLSVLPVIAERYVYVGMVGVIIPSAVLIQKISALSPNKKSPLVIFTVIILALSIRTVNRNADWKNLGTFWAAIVRSSPANYQAHFHLGNAYFDQGNYQGAREEYLLALTLKPDFTDIYPNLALAYQQEGHYEEAITNYQKALAHQPDFWPAHQNLAAIYSLQGKLDLALEETKKAIALNPQNPFLFNNLGGIYLDLGDWRKAEEAFQNTLKLDPHNEYAKREIEKIQSSRLAPR